MIKSKILALVMGLTAQLCLKYDSNVPKTVNLNQPIGPIVCLHVVFESTNGINVFL